ncbi:MAG: AtpZ/AtpI family protein [Pseudomonadota bacterium]|nr:AtpZ/AtpI family protein [Gammaproteobacteria bacterium]
MNSPPKIGWLLVGVGTNLASMVIVGFLLGYAFDAWLDSRPWLMFIFGCLGFVGGILRAHKLLSKWG